VPVLLEALVPQDLWREVSKAAEQMGALGKLAVAYAYHICIGETGCTPRAAIWATIGLLQGGVPRETPAGLTSTVLTVLEEAQDASLQPPKTLLTRVALDAEALSRAGAIHFLVANPPGNLEELLRTVDDALSYAVSLDYILYTRTARMLAAKLKPHTIAYGRWLAEELAPLGVKLAYRAEAVYEGHIAILDLTECPNTRSKPVKEAILKPRSNCVEYRLTYTCPDRRIEIPICIPETTRAT
jgi:hypothetical protein